MPEIARERFEITEPRHAGAGIVERETTAERLKIARERCRGRSLVMALVSVIAKQTIGSASISCKRGMNSRLSAAARTIVRRSPMGGGQRTTMATTSPMLVSWCSN